MKVDWTRPALTDLESHYDFVASQNPRAAADQLGLVLEAVRLTRHPRMGRSGDVRGTRELAVPGTPYVAVYRVREDACEILRVDQPPRYDLAPNAPNGRAARKMLAPKRPFR